METVVKYEVKVPSVELNVEDVKKYIAPKATDQELYYFLNIAKSYGLNPFKREIHFVKRKFKDDAGNWHEKGDTVVGYGLYLRQAESTGKLAGWKCWIESDTKGEKAIIEITRKDWTVPFRWEVYRSEFDKGQSTWKSMPTFMLKKVAIAQGFRLAFPEEMGGLPYIPEEINGHGSETLEKEEVKTEEKKEPTKKEEPKEKGHAGSYCGTINGVEEKISKKTDKPYWTIKTLNGDFWTYDPGIAEMAMEAHKVDGSMTWEVDTKGKMINLKVATIPKQENDIPL